MRALARSDLKRHLVGDGQAVAFERHELCEDDW